GGGDVATRKAVARLDGGASVRVRAPIVNPTLLQRAVSDEHLLIEQRPYDQSAIGDATLVVAATDDRAANARIGTDARGAHRLVVAHHAPGAGHAQVRARHARER